MAELVYRVVSACGALGGGCPRESLQKTLQKALNERVEAVIAVAGSMTAGSHCPDGGAAYVERDAIKNDLRCLVEAGKRIDGPVIVGNCGIMEGDCSLNRVLDIAQEIFDEQQVRDVKVAVIRSEVDPEMVIDEWRNRALRPIGAAPALDETALRASLIVGQMGIHPLVAALKSGAKYVFVGRAFEAALFAADMIRRGISPGLAYHVGHVLGSGATACEPGSLMDCLVAEIYDDASAIFVAPNEGLRCTPYSIAAHSFHEAIHPQLQFYPEGVLAMTQTEYFAVDAFSAGIRGSRFYRTGTPWRLGIKLEGVRRRGVDDESTIHHLLQNGQVIRTRMFPISYYRASGREWLGAGEAHADYFEVGDLASTQDLDARTLCVIEDAPQRGRLLGSQALLEMARVVRGKRMDTGWLVMDLFFVSEETYEMALASNAFCARNLAAVLDIKSRCIVGSYFVDSCSAIRIAIARPRNVVPFDGQDHFGDRLQSAIEGLIVPMYVDLRLTVPE